MNTNTKSSGTREGFFEFLLDLVKRHAVDETITHVYVIAFHGVATSTTIGRMPVTFTHNMPDDLTAIEVLNKLSVELYLAQQEREKGQTRQ